MRSTARLSWERLLLASLMLSATSACVIGSTGPVPLNGYCAIAEPISYDTTRDSAETITQIEAHNSKYVCVCENDCPSSVKP